MPAYFDMPASYTIDDVGAKSVPIRSSCNEKMQVMLTKLAGIMKLYHHV
jgi:hypothetical protein